MGATYSTPLPPDSIPTPTTDDRPLLERLLDPSGVLSATSTHPALVRHLNPNPDNPTPTPSTTPPPNPPSDSHISLSIDTTSPEQQDTLHNIPLDQPAQLDHPHDSTSDESYVDSALALIAPRPVVAMLASPQVSGEMKFEEARRNATGGRATPGSSTLRVTV